MENGVKLKTKNVGNKMKKPRPTFTKRDISNLQIALMFIVASYSLVFNILHADDDIDTK